MTSFKYALLGATAWTFAGIASANAVEEAPAGKPAFGDFTLAERISSRISSGEPVRIVLGVAGTGIPIQGPAMRIGMERGCAAEQSTLTAECRNVGPVNPNPAQQLAELETLLNSGEVDCLALQPPLPNQFNGIVNRYADAGIPVFTLNIDTPNAKRIAHYALNEEQAGEINGKVTAEIVKEKGIEVDTIAMGSGAPDQPWAQSRMKGFATGYTSVFPDANFFNDYRSALPTGRNFTTQEVLNSVSPFLTANPNVTLFFHTDQGVEGVGNIIRSRNLIGSTFTSGFNVSGPILDAIDQDATLVTIDQGFDNQAEAAVRACIQYLATGEAPVDPLQYLLPVVITKAGGADQITVEQAKERLRATQ